MKDNVHESAAPRPRKDRSGLVVRLGVIAVIAAAAAITVSYMADAPALGSRLAQSAVPEPASDAPARRLNALN